MRNKEVLHAVKEGRNMLHKITRRKGNYFGHSLHRNFLLKHITEGKIKGGMDRSDKKMRKKVYTLTGMH